MLLVLRVEQKNPASYLARLSRDVLEHYLVNQYTPCWLEEANWSLKTEEIIPKRNSHPPCPWKELVLDGDLLIFHSDGYFHPEVESYGFGSRYYQYDTKIYFNFRRVIVRINLAFQVEKRWVGDRITLTDQGQLVITDSRKEEPKLLIFDHPAMEEPRCLLMPPEFNYTHALGYGIIYLLNQDGTRLSLFSLDQGQLLRHVDISDLKLKQLVPIVYLRRVVSPREICYIDITSRVTLIAGK